MGPACQRARWRPVRAARRAPSSGQPFARPTARQARPRPCQLRVRRSGRGFFFVGARRSDEGAGRRPARGAQAGSTGRPGGRPARRSGPWLAGCGQRECPPEGRQTRRRRVSTAAPLGPPEPAAAGSLGPAQSRPSAAQRRPPHFPCRPTVLSRSRLSSSPVRRASRARRRASAALRPPRRAAVGRRPQAVARQRRRSSVVRSGAGRRVEDSSCFGSPSAGTRSSEVGGGFVGVGSSGKVQRKAFKRRRRASKRRGWSRAGSNNEAEAPPSAKGERSTRARANQDANDHAPRRFDLEAGCRLPVLGVAHRSPRIDG